MPSTNPRPLPPPVELVRDKQSVIIVSSRKPVAVYFSRAMSLVEKQILPDKKSKVTGAMRIEFVACGGAISRCQQVARYVIQALNEKYRHIFSNVSKSVSFNKGIVVVNDAVHVPADGEEENAFDVQQERRQVDQIRISISAVAIQ